MVAMFLWSHERIEFKSRGYPRSVERRFLVKRLSRAIMEKQTLNVDDDDDEDDDDDSGGYKIFVWRGYNLRAEQCCIRRVSY